MASGTWQELLAFSPDFVCLLLLTSHGYDAADCIREYVDFANSKCKV